MSGEVWGASVGVWDLNLRRFGQHDRKSRRAQLSIRHGGRNYERSVAGLGTDKAERYFASDFEWNRLFGASKIDAVEVVMNRAQQRGTARVRPVQQCSTGSKAKSAQTITQRSQNCFNWLKRKENALVLSPGSLIGPKID
jgi:hypothetical protein